MTSGAVPARPGYKPADDHRPRREVCYRSLGVWEFTNLTSCIPGSGPWYKALGPRSKLGESRSLGV